LVSTNIYIHICTYMTQNYKKLPCVSDQLNPCQIFRGACYQNREKCTKWAKNVPNGHIKSQMPIKYHRWPLNISTFSNLSHSKIYPNWNFWFENKPSGNPYPSWLRFYAQQNLIKARVTTWRSRGQCYNIFNTIAQTLAFLHNLQLAYAKILS
jgi:hypothetical protein